MKFTAQIHQRHSIRLKGYDYSVPGAYFITLVTRGYICRFGKVSDGFMNCNYLGEITRSVWQRLPDFFSIELDHWVVMPNHLHGIIWIKDTITGEAFADANYQKSVNMVADASPLQIIHGTQRGLLGAVVQNFKSISTRKIHEVLSRGEAFAGGQIDKNSGIMANASSKQIWQRNYYDRIIRDEKELNRIRQYIIENPYQWSGNIENLSP